MLFRSGGFLQRTSMQRTSLHSSVHICPLPPSQPAAFPSDHLRPSPNYRGTSGVCALQESISPVLCKFWQFCGGVNGDLLQEGLSHTRVCCTQSPCLCSSPLLTHTTTGDTQTQFCLSLCVVSESWCTQGLFEPSECLWQVQGLILNMISPLLPSF